VITTAGLRSFFAKRSFLGLLLLAWTPFLVRAVQIYAAANVPQASFLAPTAATFSQFLAQQSLFVFFITVYVGAGLIANDRRANALQIYLSKPITRVEYVLGKLAIVVIFILMVTWLPAVVLLLIQIAFAGNFTFFRANLFLFPAITAFTCIEALLAGASVLALSSLSNSSRYVAILYAALIFFSQALFGVMKNATGDTWWSWMSMANNLTQVRDAIFGRPLDYGPPWPTQLVIIVAFIVVCGVVLERRVSSIEVVA
jgi:ABC-type transport system involved in multi-copper enzyme maturation permease subunit